VDDDGGFSIDRAFVLTDAASRAFLLFDDGPLLLVAHNREVGTLFVADEADFLRIPGNAPGLVDVSHPHLDEAFFFNGKGSDRFRRTDPAAKITELLTIANTGNETGRIKTCKAGFQKGRLKGIVRANLQTFAAARAGRDKIILRKRPRGTYETAIFLAALCLKRVRFDHQSRNKTKTKGTEDVPP
jgi:hypothetical protein